MSVIENNLDHITNMITNIFQWTLFQLPTGYLPVLMTVYTYLQSTLSSTLKRFSIIKKSIVESFDSEYIYYLQYDSYYIPFIHRKSRFLFLKGNVEWTYSLTTNMFYNHFINSDDSDDCDDELNEKEQLHNINYIGASVRYYINNSNYISIGDMSEWLMDQRVSTNKKQIPLQVLVSAWAYSSGISLNHNYMSYVVTLMDLEGNEHFYDLQHGIEFLPEDMKDHTEVLSLDTIDTMTNNFVNSQESHKEGDETVVDETVVDETVVDETVVNETVVDETIVDETVVNEIVNRIVVDKSVEESINKLINESFEKELQEKEKSKMM